MKKNAILIGLGLLLVLIFAGNAAHFYQLGFIDKLSNIIYDYRLRVSMPGGVDDRIVILDIDEKSLQEEGRWPWSRDRMARLMDELFNHYQVSEVGFDIVFAEPDNSSGLDELQKLGQKQLKSDHSFQSLLANIKPQLEYDRQFAEAIKNRKIILGFYLNNQQSHQVSGSLPPSLFPPGEFKNTLIGFTKWTGYGANLAEFQSVAWGAGHFNPLVDGDGVVRRIPMIAEYNGDYYPSLSLAMAMAYFDHAGIQPGYAEDKEQGYSGLEWINLVTSKNVLKIPVDHSVATFVPFRGRQGSFRYISLASVLHGEVDDTSLKGKIILVGTTAPGLMDLRSTPVGEIYPGVEVHANMIAGILDQNLKEQPAYMVGAEVVWLLILGVSLSILMPLISPMKAILIAVFAFVFAEGLSLYLWQHLNIVMPIANSLVMVALLFALNMSYGYFVESHAKKQITSLFGQYVPGEVVDELSKRHGSVSMESVSREMTILFTDVRGFTTIAEQLDPKQLALLMNDFLTPLSRIVYKHKGTIDKYMGDCIMAFWGAPLEDSMHARNAILAGIEMQKALRELQESFRQRKWPAIEIGIGINTGRVSVGNMGSEVRVAYTVMGDEVNLASRLEGLTKQYGVGIIVGENTGHKVPDFVYRELDHVRVKGKDRPVAIFEPLGPLGTVDGQVLKELSLFQEMRRHYLNGEWHQADSILLELRKFAPDSKLYMLYVERTAHFRQFPPTSDWDGVFDFSSK